MIFEYEIEELRAGRLTKDVQRNLKDLYYACATKWHSNVTRTNKQFFFDYFNIPAGDQKF